MVYVHGVFVLSMVLLRGVLFVYMVYCLHGVFVYMVCACFIYIYGVAITWRLFCLFYMVVFFLKKHRVFT